MKTDLDKIEKIIELKSPVARVWRALTDADEFGEWFRVDLDGPFEPGRTSTGKMTYPGYEGYPWVATVERMEHERLFSFRWQDLDEKSDLDISQQATMLVEFTLEATPSGTRLSITESGFSSMPDPRRIEALRENTEGWNIQAKNISDYVTT
jgi:uncharacterized protein YndB with AHSA1/START domain